jgi:hypothetical protein
MRHLPLCLAALLLAPVALTVTGCGETKVSRTDNRAVRDLSGRWNATDSRETAEDLIAQALKGAWIENFVKTNNRNPTVKIGKITVRVDEVINTEIFTNDLIRALVNSGRVDVVASSSETEQARQERKEQDVNASEATRKESFQEVGADFIIIGTIASQNDQEDNLQQKFYSVDLKVTDIKTQKQVGFWNHKVTKDVERSSWK